MYGRISFLRDTKRIGDVSEIKIAAALVEAGYRIFFPFGENHRYDLLAEASSGAFLRVQVKTGRLRRGAILFKCYSVHVGAMGTTMKPYDGQVDLFGVYCPDNGACYLIPAGEARGEGYLRVEPPRNNQKKLVKWARDYEIAARGATRAVGSSGEGGVSLFGPPL